MSTIRQLTKSDIEYLVREIYTTTGEAREAHIKDLCELATEAIGEVVNYAWFVQYIQMVVGLNLTEQEINDGIQAAKDIMRPCIGA